VTPRPLIFISAVSRELRSARQLVAKTLTFLGYQAIWQDIFGTETGDLRSVLREKIDQCKGVVQLVGQCYGFESPTPDQEFGRVSYTQYEALYARKRGKKVWYLFIDESFPIDAHEPEPAELRELQATYRKRLQSDTHVFHPLTSSEALEASVLKLRDDLTRLRRSVKQWAVGVTALLALIAGLVIWQLWSQAQMKTEMKSEMAKLREGIMAYPQMEAQVRGAQTEKDPAGLQERVYADLAKQLGVDAKVLREKLPRFAEDLKHAPDASAYERANAAYVAKDYVEAERLALQAADEADKASPSKPKDILQALTLAGLAAQQRIEYARAMEHFREAEKLTDRTRTPAEWANVQYAIANLLFDQGRYRDAENVARAVLEVRTQVLGSEHPDTLKSRNRLAVALWRQAKFIEAEADFRKLIKLDEKALGPEHPDTLKSRHCLAAVLYREGKYVEAEAEERPVLKLREKVLGIGNPDTLRTRMIVAEALSGEGKHVEAEAEFRELIKLQSEILGPENPETLVTRQWLAWELAQGGKYAEAEADFRELIKVQEKVQGPEHPDTLLGRDGLAWVLGREGKHSEAEADFRELIKLHEKGVGPEHPDTLQAREWLAVVLDDEGKHAEAEALFREVIKLFEKVEGPEHPDTLDSCYDFASGLKRQNRFEEAKEFARRAADGARKILGPDHPSTRKYEKLLQELE
jgi:tetratricopeptide (TPR) repeat protein